jgi:GntR family transcriptional repressor for pyruvate dehydrogenase complex
VLIERIVEGILNGALEGGSCLPSERRLAEKLGVSRAIIREAFSALQISGLIERKSGSGSFIAPVHDLSVLKTRALSILKVSPEPYTVWRAREVLEPAIGEMVIKAVCEADLTQIKDALALMADASGKQDWNNYFEADYRFHMAITLATHNLCVIQALEPLLTQMRSPLWRTMKRNYFLLSPDNVAALESGHRDIYIAIRDRSINSFKLAMDSHFRILRTVMEYNQDLNRPSRE